MTRQDGLFHRVPAKKERDDDGECRQYEFPSRLGGEAPRHHRWRSEKSWGWIDRSVGCGGLQGGVVVLDGGGEKKRGRRRRLHFFLALGEERDGSYASLQMTLHAVGYCFFVCCCVDAAGDGSALEEEHLQRAHLQCSRVHGAVGRRPFYCEA